MSLAVQDRSALSALLARTSDNSAFYAALTAADGVSEINEMAGFRVDPRYRWIRVDQRLGTANEFEIALVDDMDLSVAYYDKVTLWRGTRSSSRDLAHNLVWRSASRRHSLALSDISRKVLFCYIVKHFDILLTAETTIHGGNFYWHRLVSQAIEQGLHVCVCELTSQELRPITSQQALRDLQDQAWSEANSETLRAIISIFAQATRVRDNGSE
ncbi:hypothetical protein PYEL_19290 [Pseudomonas sp. URMO17WK12:I11]|uniref:hypothetical protein n=1 Tax=Pseudomonas sp. URMO17WK12:I11 TaxID=1283291 RepID=UPI0007227632|nr:hypothetical protein [Pseudomonas sp. URMO17WK12:I11]CRN06137.1 hypothetical protein PYEL_19290 [Pseudomonas sp. URMO17WK12:I11]